MKESTGQPELRPVRDPATRKPYRRPAIISREPLEAIAGVCTPAQGGKSMPGDPTCGFSSS